MKEISMASARNLRLALLEVGRIEAVLIGGVQAIGSDFAGGYSGGERD